MVQLLNRTIQEIFSTQRVNLYFGFFWSLHQKTLWFFSVSVSDTLQTTLLTRIIWRRLKPQANQGPREHTDFWCKDIQCLHKNVDKPESAYVQPIKPWLFVKAKFQLDLAVPVHARHVEFGLPSRLTPCNCMVPKGYL